MWLAIAASPALTKRIHTSWLTNLLRSLVEPKIAEHRGRVVKNTGDGFLAEFSSGVDAVRCALDVQRGMADRNINVPQEKRIEFRMGINIGDVIIDRGDIFGDGVNIAARLEGVAEPGGICVSGRVLEDVQGKPRSPSRTQATNSSRTSFGRSAFTGCALEASP